MEKKTIGSFIAALRRASGMTQKELAERLYVSDKTVSRWECDESAPDLSLIPVIADIFGITSDELLRGERRSAAIGDSVSETHTERKDRSEKSFKTLLSNRLNSFKNLSWISVGVAFLGLFIALICNFGFLRAIIGFCIGAFFILASVICQICFINMKYFRNEDEVFCDAVNDFNFSVYKVSRKVFLLDIALFCLILPFLIEYTYAGLSSDAWLLMGLCFALPITLFAIVFSETFVFKKLANSGMIAPSTAETAICEKKIRFLKKRSPLYLAIAVALCILIGVALNLPHFITKPLVFNDYESFKKYMATPMQWGYDDDFVVSIAPIDPNVEEVLPPDETVDDLEDYYPKTEVKDSDGNVLFTFVHRNENVARITFSDAPDKLPIKVYTYEAWNDAQETGGIISAFLALSIAADAIAFLIVYFFKLKDER